MVDLNLVDETILVLVRVLYIVDRGSLHALIHDAPATESYLHVDPVTHGCSYQTESEQYAKPPLGEHFIAKSLELSHAEPITICDIDTLT